MCIIQCTAPLLESKVNNPIMELHIDLFKNYKNAKEKLYMDIT